MKFVFLALLVLNIGAFGYYSYLYEPKDNSESVQQMKSTLKNPVNVTNVSSELPPQIGSK